MLQVKTKKQNSFIHGIGLFADEDISKDTIIWKFDSNFDLLFSDDDLKMLSKFAREQVINYAYFDKIYNKYILCGDDARFFNHSEDCNCDDSVHNITIALRDIKKGEELTANYWKFDGNSGRLDYIKNNLQM